MARAILFFLFFPAVVYSAKNANNCAHTFEDIVRRVMTGELGDLDKYRDKNVTCQANCDVDWDTFVVQPMEGFPNCEHIIKMNYVCGPESGTTTAVADTISLYIACAPKDDPSAHRRVYDDSLASGVTRRVNFDHCPVGINLLLIVFSTFGCEEPFMRLRDVPVNITDSE